MRIAGAVILGYIVMFAVVFVTFSGAFALLGVERSFQPSSYEVTMLWIVVSIVLSLFAAVAGGLVCAIVAKSPWGPKALAALAIVLGLALAVPVLTQVRHENGWRSANPRNSAHDATKSPLHSVFHSRWVGMVISS